MVSKDILSLINICYGYDPSGIFEDLCKYQDQKKYVAHLEEEISSLRKLNSQISSDIVNLRNEHVSLKEKLKQRGPFDIDEKIKALKNENIELLKEVITSRKDKESCEEKLNTQIEELELANDALKEDRDNLLSERDFYESKWKEVNEILKKQKETLENNDATLKAAAKHIRKLETMIEKYKELQSLYEGLLSKSKEISS